MIKSSMNKGKGSASLCRAANVSFVKLSPVYFTLSLIDKVVKTINKKPFFIRIIISCLSFTIYPQIIQPATIKGTVQKAEIINTTLCKVRNIPINTHC